TRRADKPRASGLTAQADRRGGPSARRRPWPWPGCRIRSPPPFPGSAARPRVAATRPLPRGRRLIRSGVRTPAPRASRSTAIPGGRSALRRPSPPLRRASGRPSSLLVRIEALVPDLRLVREDGVVLLDPRLLVELIEPRPVQLVLLLHLEALAEIGLFRVRDLRRVGALASLDGEDIGRVALVDGGGGRVAGLRKREDALGKPGSEPDARNVPAHRMERLGALRLRREEGRHVELPRLLLLRRIQVLEGLARLHLREGLLGLLLGQGQRLLGADLLGRDLLSHLVERLDALLPPLLRLEDVEARPVLEDGGDLARLQLQGLLLEGGAVGRSAAGDEPEVATVDLRRGVLALLLRHFGEVLARLHLGERSLDALLRRLLLLGRRPRRRGHRDGPHLRGGRLPVPGLLVLVVGLLDLLGVVLDVRGDLRLRRQHLVAEHE